MGLLQVVSSSIRPHRLAGRETVALNATVPAQALETVIEELLPDVFHNTDRYANNRVECDHRRLKARLRPMRGLKTDRTASVVIAGHALMQNVRRGRYELGLEAEPRLRVATSFEELREAI